MCTYVHKRGCMFEHTEPRVGNPYHNLNIEEPDTRIISQGTCYQILTHAYTSLALDSVIGYHCYELLSHADRPWLSCFCFSLLFCSHMLCGIYKFHMYLRHSCAALSFIVCEFVFQRKYTGRHLLRALRSRRCGRAKASDI